jgi:MFS family permease
VSSPGPAEPEPLGRNRNFNLLWVGGAFSAVGSRASAIAFPLLVLAVGGSPGDAGLVAAAATVPLLLFQIPAGPLVDRWDRRLVMIVTDAGRAAAIGSVAVVALFGTPTLPHLAIAAFTEGSLFACHVLAQRCAVQTVVPQRQLRAALSRNEITARAAFLSGQPIGGLLFALGRAAPFVFDFLTYLLSLATTLLMRGRFRVPPAARRQSVLADARDGFRWLWHERFLRTAAGAIAVSNMLLHAAYLTVIVVITEQGGSPVLVGFVLAGTGAGGIIGAIMAPWIARQTSMANIFIGVNWTWALLILLIATVNHPLMSAVGFAVFAFAGATSNVVLGAYQIRITPQPLMARVSAVIGTVSWGAIPLGSWLAGVLLDRYGGTTPLALLGGLMVAVAVAVTFNPAMRPARTAEPAPAKVVA